MRKVLVLNEEVVNNSLIESPKSSPMRPTIPSKVKIIYPTNISSDEEEEESNDESESLSLELGSVATKPNAKATATLTSKDFVQTKSVPDPTEQQKANVAIKRQQPIVATESEEIEPKSFEDNDEFYEEFDAEKEPKEEDEVIMARPHQNPLPSPKIKERVSNPQILKGMLQQKPSHHFSLLNSLKA